MWIVEGVSFEESNSVGVGGDGLLGAGVEVAEDEFGELVADDQGVGSEGGVGCFDLFVELGLGEGVVDADAGLAQLLDESEGVRALFFVVDDEVDVAAGVALAPSLELADGASAFLDEEADDDVAHREAHRRKVGFSIGEGRNEGVVASASGDGAEGAFGVEDFEDDAGVVGEAAHDGEVDFEVVSQATGFEIVLDFAQGLGLVDGVGDEVLQLLGGESERLEFGGGDFRFFAFKFVDDLEEVGELAFVEAFVD